MLLLAGLEWGLWGGRWGSSNDTECPLRGPLRPQKVTQPPALPTTCVRKAPDTHTTGILINHVTFKHTVCLTGNQWINDQLPKSLLFPRPYTYEAWNAKALGL